MILSATKRSGPLEMRMAKLTEYTVKLDFKTSFGIDTVAGFFFAHCTSKFFLNDCTYNIDQFNSV